MTVQLSLSDQTAAAWRGAVQTARISEHGPGQWVVLVDTATILAVEAELAAANKRAEAAVGHLATAERALAEARERDLDALQADIGAWADHTFPSHHDPAGQPNPRGPLMHLTRKDKGEVWELVRAFEAGQPLNGEVADCMMLLVSIAHLSGFSLLEAVRAKFTELQGRKWGKPDEDGIVEHVREEADRG